MRKELTASDILYEARNGYSISIEDEFGYHDVTWSESLRSLLVDGKKTTLNTLCSWFCLSSYPGAIGATINGYLTKLDKE